jgi:membrane associated rhomboid family serine protease/Flp pilus assembly protein TadD
MSSPREVPDLYCLQKPGLATLSLLVTVVAAWVMAASLGLARLDQLHLLFVPAKVWTGRPEGLLTSTLLHTQVFHLLVNLLGIVYFGAMAEKSLGGRRMLAVFFVSAIFGNLFSCFLTPFPRIPSVGASGGIMGFLGAHVTATALRSEDPRALFLEPRNRRLTLVLVFFLILEALALSQPLLLSSLNHAAHLGGLLGGAALAALLVDRDTRRLARGSFAAILLFLLLVGGYGLLPLAGPSYHEVLAQEALLTADYEGAESQSRRALTLSEDRVEAQIVLGTAARGLGLMKEAESHLRRAAELSASGSALVILAEFLESQGAEDRLEVYEKARSRLISEIAGLARATLADEQRAGLRNNLAWLHAVFGRNLEEALALALRATSAFPAEPAFLGTLGVVELGLGRPSDAASHLERACDLHRDRLSLAHDMYYYSLALSAAGRKDEADRALDRAIELDPRAPVRRMVEGREDGS